MAGRQHHTGPLDGAPAGGGVSVFLQGEWGMEPKGPWVPVQSPFPGPTCSPVLCHCPQNGHCGDGWAGCGYCGDSQHRRDRWGGWGRTSLAQCCSGCLWGHRPSQGRGGFCRCRGGGTWQRAGGPVWQAWAQLPGLPQIPNTPEITCLPT